MTTLCDVIDNCTECPRYGDDCDGDKMAEHTDLISRADAIEAVQEYYQKRFTEDSKWDADAKMFVLEDKTIAKDNMEICNIINALPSAEAVKGEWQKVEEQPYFRKHYDTVCCSVCRKKGDRKWNFCPNCGARMKGGAE